jgi:type IV secretory pathway VirB4 component
MANTINPNETFGSQKLLPISEIRNNVIILKNGSLRSVIEIKGINLTLLPVGEQEAMIYS